MLSEQDDVSYVCKGQTVCRVTLVKYCMGTTILPASNCIQITLNCQVKR